MFFNYYFNYNYIYTAINDSGDIRSIQTQMHTQITTCTVQILVVVFGDRSRPGLIER